MAVTEFWVVRHGRTAANQSGVVQGQSNVPLDELGLRQAELLAGRLRGESFDAVYASDLDRAMTTARIAAPGCEIIPDRALREWNLGAWVGKTVPEVKALFPEEWDGFVEDREGMTVTGGESRAQLHERVGAFLEEAARRHRGGRVLVVSHCCVIRVMLRHVLGFSGSWPHQPQIGNVSLSRFLNDGGSWILGCWNDTSHLANCASAPDGY